MSTKIYKDDQLNTILGNQKIFISYIKYRLRHWGLITVLLKLMEKLDNLTKSDNSLTILTTVVCEEEITFEELFIVGLNYSWAEIVGGKYLFTCGSANCKRGSTEQGLEQPAL